MSCAKAEMSSTISSSSTRLCASVIGGSQTVGGVDDGDPVGVSVGRIVGELVGIVDGGSVGDNASDSVGDGDGTCGVKRCIRSSVDEMIL